MTTPQFWKLIFAASVALVVYTFIIYPLVLFALAAVKQAWTDFRFAFSRRDRRQPARPGELPAVSLVFSAYNEEAIMPAKLRNCERLNYPADKLEILIGCDGCTDRTAELARASGLPNLRVFESSERSGKPGMLNRLAPKGRGDIVVFCDANTMLDPDAITSLVRHFSDLRVGCVCGELRLDPAESGSRNESLYWRYEVFLKFFESRLNMLVGANGALYAIRRSLFTPLPPQGIIDDFLEAMQIRAQGYRVIYDPDAAAYEEAAATVREEFHRRVRIGAGNIHALRFTWRSLLPTAGSVSFSYWSHKVFRWICPFALLLALISALALSEERAYAACATAGLLVAFMALAGYRQELRRVHRAPFSIAYYFVSMNLALLLGFLRFVTGRQTVVWRPTLRDNPGVK